MPKFTFWKQNLFHDFWGLTCLHLKYKSKDENLSNYHLSTPCSVGLSVQTMSPGVYVALEEWINILQSTWEVLGAILDSGPYYLKYQIITLRIVNVAVRVLYYAKVWQNTILRFLGSHSKDPRPSFLNAERWRRSNQHLFFLTRLKLGSNA